MKTSNVIAELAILFRMKTGLLAAGRSTEYGDDNRIKELQKFLDSQEDEKIEIDPVKQGTVLTTDPVQTQNDDPVKSEDSEEKDSPGPSWKVNDDIPF